MAFREMIDKIEINDELLTNLRKNAEREDEPVKKTKKKIVKKKVVGKK